MNIVLVGCDPWFTGWNRALAGGLRSLGHFVETRKGMPPVAECDLLVCLGPHEYGPPPAGIATKVAIWTEHDSSQFFHEALGMTGSQYRDLVSGWYDIVVSMIDGQAGRLAIPFLPAWPEFEAHDSALSCERPVGCYWYGTVTPRRKEILDSIASEVEIVIPTARIWGEAKEDALRAAKVTVLPHAWDGPCAEPFRYADAAATGTILVCEAAEKALPYDAGSHFVSVPASEMAAAVKHALANFDSYREMRRRALENARRYDACFAAKGLLELVG